MILSGSRPLREIPFAVLGPRRVTVQALPPDMSVEGLLGRKENGLTLTIYDVYYTKPMFPPGGHGRGPRLAL